MTSELFKVTASFQDADGQPLAGPEYTVSLRDEDRFFDDNLGKTSPDANGSVDFIVAVADIHSVDSFAERTPDLYFVVEKDGREIFRSDVFHEVDFEADDPVTGRKKGLTQTFGPFRVGAD